MKLDFWEVFFLIVTWWVGSVCANYLDWTWQLNYDTALQAHYNTGSGDMPLEKDQ